MIFSSYTFIFIFLPITLAGYAVFKKLKKVSLIKAWLVLASLVFYSWNQISFLPIFLATLLLNYLFIFLLGKTSKRYFRTVLLILGIGEGLGVLFYYKYLNFALYSFNRFLGTDLVLYEIILPLGISFYTFQIMTYLIDVYKREAEISPVLDYLCYVTFFPQLIVGPILRHERFVPQLREENLTSSNPNRITLAILLFSIGCAKKILIADPLIEFAQSYYGQDGGTTLTAWLATLSYTLAYYFDFSAYGDMAVGLGHFFNIKLPFNFNSPYKARNMADFWRRWNISVSRFFDDYVFRNIFRFGDRIPKLILATLITFIVSGIWHGAGWNYVLWGLVNGILVALVNISAVYSFKLPSVIAYPLTAVCVVLTRVLFDSSSFTEIKKTYSLMFSKLPLSELYEGIKSFVCDNTQTAVILLLGAVICFFFKNTKEIAEDYKPRAHWAVISAVLLTLSLINMSHVSGFLYFNF